MFPLSKMKNLIYVYGLNNVDSVFDLTSSNLPGESITDGDFLKSNDTITHFEHKSLFHFMKYLQSVCICRITLRRNVKVSLAYASLNLE